MAHQKVYTVYLCKCTSIGHRKNDRIKQSTKLPVKYKLDLLWLTMLWNPGILYRKPKRDIYLIHLTVWLIFLPKILTSSKSGGIHSTQTLCVCIFSFCFSVDLWEHVYPSRSLLSLENPNSFSPQGSPLGNRVPFHQHTYTTIESPLL